MMDDRYSKPSNFVVHAPNCSIQLEEDGPVFKHGDSCATWTPEQCHQQRFRIRQLLVADEEE